LKGKEALGGVAGVWVGGLGGKGFHLKTVRGVLNLLVGVRRGGWQGGFWGGGLDSTSTTSLRNGKISES